MEQRETAGLARLKTSQQCCHYHKDLQPVNNNLCYHSLASVNCLYYISNAAKVESHGKIDLICAKNSCCAKQSLCTIYCIDLKCFFGFASARIQTNTVEN